MQVCIYCHKEGANLVVHDRTTTKKIRYTHQECRAAKQRKYYATAKGKSIVRRVVRKYAESNPEKVKAWTAAQYKNSPQPCEVCGKNNAHRHHPDYSKPTEIVFLCPLHHRQLHTMFTK